nr:hypothetical protein Iba_chr05cCG5640 [Ipomoea batatas]
MDMVERNFRNHCALAGSPHINSPELPSPTFHLPLYPVTYQLLFFPSHILSLLPSQLLSLLPYHLLSLLPYHLLCGLQSHHPFGLPSALRQQARVQWQDRFLRYQNPTFHPRQNPAIRRRHPRISHGVALVISCAYCHG